MMMQKSACTVLLVLGAALMVAPMALAAQPANDNPACAQLEKTALGVPEWYASTCLGGIVPDQEPVAGPWRVPGDLAIYLSNFSPNAALSRRLLSAPLPTATYTNIAPCGANPLNIFAMDFDLTATTLWAIDSGCSTGVCTARGLGTINQTTGAFTVTQQVTGPPTGSNFAGLKFDPTSSNVYIAVIAGGASSLWTLNLSTGAATQVGGTITGFLIDIAISNTGQMYGHEILSDQLLSIDKTTGVATVIGPTGINANFAQGLDFDPTDNTLYAFVIKGDTTASISTVNLTTGAFTSVTINAEELEGAVKLAAQRMTATSLVVDNAGNKVMEPGETVIVAPGWRNDGSLQVTGVTGTFSNFTGPAGGTYTITDSTAAYGDIAPAATGTCTGDCYGVMASGTRPAQHWDSAVQEVLSVPGQTKTWTLHIGGSFTDVLPTNGFYRFVETIFHKGVTGGCGTGIYCPANPTTREQMAVFALKSKEGTAYTPPPCASPNLFSDVPDTSPFCAYIEELANRQVVSGCGPNLYCPTNPVTREQMSIFMLKTLDPTLNPPACAPPNLFLDVPESSPFCKWIEELANRGVVSGCGGGNYCPTQSVTREQMGVFLSVTFSLSLYGV